MRWFGRRDRDYCDEIEAHIEFEVRENIERGMSPGNARQAALRKFGNALSTREKLADARPLHFWATLDRDIRYGARSLMRSPGLTATVVLTLALGIGANTAIFSLVEAVMLRTLPVQDPRSLVIARALTRQGNRDWFSHTDYEWLRDHNRSFASLAASGANWRYMLDLGGRKERVGLTFVSGNYFPMLGVEPAAGRMLSYEDDNEVRPVAVISYAFFERFYGGAAALGKELRLERTALEIVGVAPRGFKGEYEGAGPDFWVPLSVQPAVSGRSSLRRRNASWIGVMGRLRAGVSVRQAQAEMRPLLEALRADLHVDGQNDYLGSIGLEPGGGGISNVRYSYAQPLRVLMALVAIVLLIGCANVANLLLARSAARGREFAVRLAMGAGRFRLIRQLLTESFLLAAIACLAGIGIAQVLVQVLVAASQVPALKVQMNWTVLAFAAAISCASAIAFGLAPALQSRRVDPWTTLKEGRITGSIGRFRPSRVLIVTQTAFSMVLLISGGLLLRTFLNLKAVHPGFDDRVIEARLDTSPVSGNGSALGFRLVERISALPGVQAVSFSPAGFGQGTGRSCCFSPEGYTPRPDEDKNLRQKPVSPGYFRTMGIPMIAGRDFTEADRDGSQQVAIINETTARHYFSDTSAVGKRFSWAPAGPKDTEIVGVVSDAKYDNLRQETPRLAYQPVMQYGGGPAVVQIRGTEAALASVRGAIRELNPNIRVISFEPVTTAINRTLALDLLVSWLAGGFGAVGLLLTAVGLYGILSYTVARRTSELGIRMALGAGRAAILHMVMKEAMVLVAVGVAAGLAVAGAFSHVLAKLLFGVQPRDGLTFAAAGAVLILVAAAASYWPARRATVVDPTVALRYE